MAKHGKFGIVAPRAAVVGAGLIKGVKKAGGKPTDRESARRATKRQLGIK